MNRTLRLLLSMLVGVALAAAVGFTVVHTASGDGPAPATEQDPNVFPPAAYGTR